MLMLHGPPGTGKSTLARVLAKVCGYHLEVINASDERNGPLLVNKIANAMEMTTIANNPEKKPTMLLIDEVDGALGCEDGSKGIGMVVEHLMKCIASSKKSSKIVK